MFTKRVLGGILLALSLVWLCASASAASAKQPNILFILADDVGCETLGCYGGESYETPNIDRLAAQGMRFEYCFSMPVCHPTRTTFLSGRYPFQLGYPRWGSYPKQDEQTTIAHAMKQAGYATAVAGKWQIALLGKDLQHPHRLGFDEYCLFGWHEGARYHDPLIWQNGERREGTEGKYGPDLYVQFLTDFMQKNKEQPWFAFYSMALCHDVTDDLKSPVGHAHGKDRYLNYGEMMDSMDEMVGRIVNAVEKQGQADNTVIIYTTDNGTAGRSKLRAIGPGNKFEYQSVVSKLGDKMIPGGKGSLTNYGTNVPLIIRWPGKVPEGKVVDNLVDFTDFYPTFVELAGGKSPAEVKLAGHSFAPLLQGKEFQGRTFAYAEAKGKYWVRTQRFKLYNDGQLFDVASDPQEKKPLPMDKLSPEASEAYKQLSKEMEKFKAGHEEK